MRLTKRQLKRIIREEYSRLKRRGLIKEAGELEHEQDEFLAEQLAQYGDDFCRAAAECCMAGYMEEETIPDSTSADSLAANACMFYSGGDPRPVLTSLMKCGSFRSVIDMLQDEQESMFGSSAPDHAIMDLMVDFGIADECIMSAQAGMSGNDPINLGF